MRSHKHNATVETETAQLDAARAANEKSTELNARMKMIGVAAVDATDHIRADMLTPVRPTPPTRGSPRRLGRVATPEGTPEPAEQKGGVQTPWPRSRLWVEGLRTPTRARLSSEGETPQTQSRSGIEEKQQQDRRRHTAQAHAAQARCGEEDDLRLSRAGIEREAEEKINRERTATERAEMLDQMRSRIRCQDSEREEQRKAVQCKNNAPCEEERNAVQRNVACLLQ